MAIFLEIRYSCYNKLYSNEETINLADSDANGNDQKNIKEDQSFKSIQLVDIVSVKSEIRPSMME